MSNASPAPNAPRARRENIAWGARHGRRGNGAWLAALLLLGCGRQDGVVGVLPLSSTSGAAGQAGQAGQGQAGTPEPSSAGAGGANSGFSDDFALDDGSWDAATGVDGASTEIGADDARGRDGKLATLRLPGHPEFAAGDSVGPDYVTQIGTKDRFGFGRYQTRMSFGSCAAGEETVMAFLGYFNDHQDHDGDGIIDNEEIDMQVTCSAPTRMYLTVYTDYQEKPLKYRKLTRVVDFASGAIADTTAPDNETFVAKPSEPALALPGLFTPGALAELGFEWHAGSLRFFVVSGGAEHELWLLQGADVVPQLPVFVLYNLWHPATHWYPSNASADYPASDVVVDVDWVTFAPE